MSLANRHQTLELVLDKLLPGQCIGASAWFDYAKALLQEGGMTNFVKEPTLFKHTDADHQTGLIMHADDGMLASTPKEREKLVGVLISKVKLQVSAPLRSVGDEVEFPQAEVRDGPQAGLLYTRAQSTSRHS